MSGMNQKMRIWHRYLGFYLVGIMTVYAVSGTVLIFRRTDTFKQEKTYEKTLSPNLTEEKLTKELNIKGLKIKDKKGDLLVFEEGIYNSFTGETTYTKKGYPWVLDKLINLHKATTNSPVYWLNIFFGASLLFFVISSFWMFLPNTDVFKKGLYFSLAGIIMTLVILFL